MRKSFYACRQARFSASFILLGICCGPAFAGDSYNLATKQLTIPSIVIGAASFSDLVVSIGSIVSPPYGTDPMYNGDIFAGSNQQLTVATATVGSATYYNAVVAVSGLVSIGSVSGADTYDGTNLTMPAVQVLGGNIFTNVVVGVTFQDLVSVAGGMPSVNQNQYNVATQQLTIPVVQFNGHTYTNVVVSVGLSQVKSVGGSQLADSVVHSFTGFFGTGNADGEFPTANLLLGNDGALYGTTSNGGTSGTGTVFKVSGSAETVLYSFAATEDPDDGAYPQTSVIQGSDGNFYGATVQGGLNNQGTVFKITPAGVESLLYSFKASGSGDGANPNGVMQGNDGNFYVTTYIGGANETGAVVKITPAGTGSVFYSFGPSGSNDGTFPVAALIQGADGNLYGTTSAGGSAQGGTVFSLTLLGVENVLYSFGSSGATDGEVPIAALLQGVDGNFYGTTYLGGACDAGTAFSVTPQGSRTILHSFCGNGAIGGSTDGAFPDASLIQPGGGNLYSTTNNGGAFDEGTLYSLTTGGTTTVLHSFSGGGALGGSIDGSFPDGVILGGDGNLYGAAYAGGASNFGAVFNLTGNFILPP